MIQVESNNEISTYPNRPDIQIDGQSWADIHESFSQELSNTAPHENLGDKTPRFTKPHGDYLYARLKAVQTHCEREYDNLVTVWLSLTAAEKIDDKWVHPLRHDDGFRSNPVRQALYRARKRLAVTDWAGMWIMAPRKTGYSHKHYGLWLNLGDNYNINEIQTAFHSVIDSHVRSHPTATACGNQYSKAIQLREGEGCTGLVAEMARNFPEIGPGTSVPSPDVRSIESGWKYARIWCALYSYDNRNRKQSLGDFQKIADNAKPVTEWKFGKGVIK